LYCPKNFFYSQSTLTMQLRFSFNFSENKYPTSCKRVAELIDCTFVGCIFIFSTYVVPCNCRLQLTLLCGIHESKAFL
jgi:hypothetical protein